MILINAAEILANYNAKAAGKHEKCGVDTSENPSGNLNVWSHIHPTEYARQSESQTPRTVHTSASRPDEVPNAISPTGIASITMSFCGKHDAPRPYGLPKKKSGCLISV